jgi:hypothetical protein
MQTLFKGKSLTLLWDCNLSKVQCLLFEEVNGANEVGHYQKEARAS